MKLPLVKKMLAVMLTLALIIPVLPVGIEVVQAALVSPDLTLINVSKEMSPIPVRSTPPTDSLDRTRTINARFGMSTSDFSTSDITNLVYHINNGYETIISTKLHDTSVSPPVVEISYSVKNLTTGTQQPLSLSSIYNETTATFSSSFTDQPNVKEVDDSKGNTLIFRLCGGQTIFFRVVDGVNTKTVGFYYDSNTLTVSTNGAYSAGYAYDFTLTSTKTNFIPQSKLINLGYDDGGIVSKPFAWDDYEVDPIEAKDDDGASLTVVTTDYVDPSTTGSALYTSAAAVKIAKDTGIDVYVDYPYFWNSSLNRFSQQLDNLDWVNGSPDTYGILASLSISPQIAPTINNIYDIKNGKLTINSGTQASTVTATCVPSTTSGDAIYSMRFRIEDLPPSMIYDKASMQITPSGSSKVKFPFSPFTTSIAPGVIRTYLGYIVSTDSDTYIEIDPYKYASSSMTVTGTYTVYKTVAGSEQSFYKAYPYYVNDPSGLSMAKLESIAYPTGLPTLRISLRVDTASEIVNWFGISFVIKASGNQEMYWSQWYKYKASRTDVRLGTPEIIDPIKATVVETAANQYNLLLSYEWRIGLLSALEMQFSELGAENVEYVFKKGALAIDETPPAPPNETDPFKEFVALKLVKDANYIGGYNIVLETTTAHACNYNALLVTPETIDTSGSVPLRQGGFYTKNVMVGSDAVPYAYARVDLSLPINHKDLVVPPDEIMEDELLNPTFVFPYTYFIDGYLSYDLTTGPAFGTSVLTSNSVPKSLTISTVTKFDVPSPQNFSSTTQLMGPGTIGLKWASVDPADYSRIMLQPKQYVAYDRISEENQDIEFTSTTYNIYISPTMSNLTQLMEQLKDDTTKRNIYNQILTGEFNSDPDEEPLPKKLLDAIGSMFICDMTEAEPVEDEYDDDEEEEELSPLNKYNLSELEAMEADPNSDYAIGDTTALDALRRGYTVVLKGIQSMPDEDIELILEGADRNQVYYTMVETQLIPYKQIYETITTGSSVEVPMYEEDGSPSIDSGYVDDEDFASMYLDSGGYLISKSGYSKPSATISVTTKDSDSNPDPSEVPPPAPEKLDKKDVTANGATIFWDRYKTTAENDGRMYQYQILRIRNQSLTDLQMQDKSDAETYYARLDESLEAELWQTSGTTSYYNFMNGYFDYSDVSSDITVYNKTASLTQHFFTDLSLNPNQVYFYYVRTIKLQGDDGVTPTYDDEQPTAYSVWIPISVTTTPVPAPINLKVEQSMVTDKKRSTVISFDSILKSVDMPSKGYFAVSLTVDGQELPEIYLDSDKDITLLKDSAKVSASDPALTHYIYTIKELKPGKAYTIKVRLYDTNLGDWSPYSITVMTRTDPDQDDFDIEKEITKWGDYVLKQLEELLKKPSWLISDNATSDKVYSAIIRTSMFDGEILKSKSIVQLDGAATARATYYIPMTTIKKANTANVGFSILIGTEQITIPARAFTELGTKAIQEQLANRENTDVFVRIDVNASDVKQAIDGYQPVTNVITTGFSAVGTSMTDKNWDAKTYDAVKAIISDPDLAEDIQRDIESLISQKATNEELIAYADEQVDSVQKTIVNLARTSFNQITLTIEEIEEIDKACTVKTNAKADTKLLGYFNGEEGWEAKNTITYGSQVGFTVSLPGDLTFVGNKTTVPNTGTAGDKNLTPLVAKYELGSYLGDDGKINLSSTMTQASLMGAVASLMGAKKTDTPQSFLSKKGYTLTRASVCESQQAVYLIMALYEQKTKTTVNSMKIKNYNATAKMTGIDNKYSKSILAANDLSIINAASFKPKNELTVREFLEMLGALSTKVTIN